MRRMRKKQIASIRFDGWPFKQWQRTNKNIDSNLIAEYFHRFFFYFYFARRCRFFRSFNFSFVVLISSASSPPSSSFCLGISHPKSLDDDAPFSFRFGSVLLHFTRFLRAYLSSVINYVSSHRRFVCFSFRWWCFFCTSSLALPFSSTMMIIFHFPKCVVFRLHTLVGHLLKTISSNYIFVLYFFRFTFALLNLYIYLLFHVLFCFISQKYEWNVLFRMSSLWPFFLLCFIWQTLCI